MSDKKPGLATIALHAGQMPDKETLARAVPIYQTTSYLFKNTEHAAALFALREKGNIYSRLMNPTVEALEKRLAALHGGTAAVCTASGMAAIFYAVCNIARAGQNIVSSSNLYGGTSTLFNHQLKRFGIEARFVDSSSPRHFAAAIDANTRLLFAESIGNPRCNVDDIEGIAEVAHGHGLPLVIDNTVSPPPIFDPFKYGADIAVLSLTKIVGGHGTSLGGVVIERGDFNWQAGGKFSEIAGPDSSYHGLNFWELFGDHPGAAVRGAAFTTKIRCGLLRDTGACLSPFNAQQILLGVETLPLRAKQHCANAQAVAEFLNNHPSVAWVNYAGLRSHPDYDRAKRLMPFGPSAVFGFGIKGGLKAGSKFIDSVRLCSHLANILDAKTLVIHPASTTHQQLTAEEQKAAGVTPDLIRISVGLEDTEDIIADLDQALRQAQS